MANTDFFKSASACVVNGDRLLDDATMLEYSEPPATAFALAIIAQEEFAKGFLLALVARKVIPWHPLIFRASRDHTCKQLLGIIMEHLNPDFDDFCRRHEEWEKQHEEVMQLFASLQDPNTNTAEVWQRINELRPSINRPFPASVADAIDIFRYEKIERWRSSTWVWAEDPVYDLVARKTGEGRVDRQKQDALYVRLGRSGEVAGSPVTVTPETAKEAMERARRFRNLVDSMISDSNVSEHQKELEKVMKLAFQDLEEMSPKPGDEE